MPESSSPPPSPSHLSEEKKEEAPKQQLPIKETQPPVLKVDLETPVEDSIAFSLLDPFVKKVGEDEVENFKLLYTKLWNGVKLAYLNEKNLLKKARHLNNEVLGERINMERGKINQNSAMDDLGRLEKDREVVQNTLDEMEHGDTIVKYEVQELMRVRDELKEQVEEMSIENEWSVGPELGKLREELKGMEDESDLANDSVEKDKEKQETLKILYQKLEKESMEYEAKEKRVTSILSKATLEPGRISKQSQSVSNAVENLKFEVSRLQNKSKSCTADLANLKLKRAEAEDVRSNLNHKLELHRDTIEHRERDVEAVSKNLELEKAKNHQFCTTRLEIELKGKEIYEKLRHANDGLSTEKKGLEIQKRTYRKKRDIGNIAKEGLPGLRGQVADAMHLLLSHETDNSRLVKEVEEADQEVSISIARFLKQEGTEAGRRDELNDLIADVEKNEVEIAQWNGEERKQNKLIAVLNAQREIKAREALRAQMNEKDTKEQVKVKELVILDLTKKCNEVNNRLKEFSALYDVVKNERNNYVNHIQASSQALAEMKEKIKILQNEVEILRNESIGKDKVLSKERASHQSSQAQRDNLRLDVNKAQSSYKKRQQQVEQQIVEIDKLNSIINGLEREMLRLKSSYENSVESRNFTGVQLIDRNDELCILYEKGNLQEETLKGGEMGIQQKDEDIRMLKLQLAEVQRQIEVNRNRGPENLSWGVKIVTFKAELATEKATTEQLCQDLENPGNAERWRELEGEDPDSDQLMGKVQVLEERLNGKKERLLEKELILEEVTTLTGMLRSQAGDGRAETLELAQKVNEYQAKIREVTRKMMASVAELSMYQATAMKLQQEKHLREKDLEGERQRLEDGEAPTAEAEREWYRLERDKMARDEAEANGLLAVRGPHGTGAQPVNALRTTAEPRPNAYVPSEGIGIPKPYGALAPFKPQENGTTMRHIKKPLASQIEI